MRSEFILNVLNAVAQGESTVEQAAASLSRLSFENIDFAHVDHHRSVRKGFPEVIFGEGKTSSQIIGVMEKMEPLENIILVTRIDPEKAEIIQNRFPEAVHHDDARMLILKKRPVPVRGKGIILVVTAGTSDIPVAREAFLTAESMGNQVESIFDVGVAGIHRLLHYHEKILSAHVLVVAAGMEGALPSVVAGMVSRPVIAVPTSVGYGAGFGGLAALLAMLNSCSSNVAVVNIDNGFGAGYMASIINAV